MNEHVNVGEHRSRSRRRGYVYVMAALIVPDEIHNGLRLDLTALAGRKGANKERAAEILDLLAEHQADGVRALTADATVARRTRTRCARAACHATLSRELALRSAKPLPPTAGIGRQAKPEPPHHLAAGAVARAVSTFLAGDFWLILHVPLALVETTTWVGDM